MTKHYIRYCDGCGTEIPDPYAYGVTTLYRRIRVGRGTRILNYEDGNVLNHVVEKQPDDFDGYGTGWRLEEDKEFSFCAPECLVSFLGKIYEDTYTGSLQKIKAEKEKTLDISFAEFQKKNGAVIPFFRKIQTTFSKSVFKEQAVKEADQLIATIKEIKRQVSE